MARFRVRYFSICQGEVSIHVHADNFKNAREKATEKLKGDYPRDHDRMMLAGVEKLND